MKTILFSLILIQLLFPIMALADIDLPVDNGVVTSGVGLRIDPFGSGKLVFHRGIDIAVPVGTPVHAVRKGRVIFAGERRGYGNTVIVEHDNGDRTIYGHNSLVRVSTGDLVESGTVVAFSGNTGRSTGPHVHFELQPSGRPVMVPEEKEEEQDEAIVPQLAENNEQRDFFEQQLNEAVNSVLKTINRRGVVGLGG